MKKKRTEFIEQQSTHVKELHKDRVSVDHTQWIDQGNIETALDNPDILEDNNENKLWGEGTKPELAQLIIEQFADDKGYFPILSKRQNEVLRLYLLGMEVRQISIETKRDLRNINRSLKQIQRRFQKLLTAVNL